MNRDPKTCLVCRRSFIPDHRVRQRQKVCGNLSCQLERKRRSQKQWVSTNPGYFNGRYSELKEHILRSKKNQQNNIDPTDCRLASIQDELTDYKISILAKQTETAYIQDELKTIITITKRLYNTVALQVYKTN
jgi:hypothetical protein